MSIQPPIYVNGERNDLDMSVSPLQGCCILKGQTGTINAMT